MVDSPKHAGFRQPGEWAPHRACWLAFPSDPELWPELDATQASFFALCRAIAQPTPELRGEKLEVLVQSHEAGAQAEPALAGLDARIHVHAFGDIWMRDIAPVFLTNGRGEVASVRFRFNGWGEKYVYVGDDGTAEAVQRVSGLPSFASSLVLEGGGVESDGTGLCMTTVDVALNPNRNPGLTRREVERELEAVLGAERVIWIERGLANDHTDGHIDNIARFFAPRKAVCMRASGSDDPNRDVLTDIQRTLEGAKLDDVVTIPSPGLVLGREGQPLPASYLNFYIANHSVVVPTFGSVHDDAALAALEPLFPGRRVIGVPAKVFVHEGGTIHCISQQEPSGAP
jgi:agmatine deiminase